MFFALRASATPAGKFLIYDAGADGLQTKPREDGKVDEAREGDVSVVRFDGYLTDPRLASAEYAQRAAAVDAKYARWLGVLLSTGFSLPAQ